MTESVTPVDPGRIITETVELGGENFTAFDSRLVRTCSSRSTSPETSTLVVSCNNCTPAASATGCIPSMAWCTTCDSCTGRKVMGARPLWMRSRSRMSLIRRTRRSELLVAMRSRLLALSLSSPRMPDDRRPKAPRIDVSGVLNSWLTVEMNSSFRRSSA